VAESFKWVTLQGCLAPALGSKWEEITTGFIQFLKSLSLGVCNFLQLGMSSKLRKLSSVCLASFRQLHLYSNLKPDLNIEMQGANLQRGNSAAVYAQDYEASSAHYTGDEVSTRCTS
jgi:hypothetical protein